MNIVYLCSIRYTSSYNCVLPSSFFDQVGLKICSPIRGAYFKGTSLMTKVNVLGYPYCLWWIWKEHFGIDISGLLFPNPHAYKPTESPNKFLENGDTLDPIDFLIPYNLLLHGLKKENRERIWQIMCPPPPVKCVLYVVLYVGAVSSITRQT